MVASFVTRLSYYYYFSTVQVIRFFPFWLFSSSLCLTLLAKLESGMMKVSLGVGSLPAGSTRFLPGWTARVSVVVAEELPQLYHDHPLALVLQEHYHHPPRSSCSRLLAARLTSSAREDQPAFPSRLLPVDSAWLQTPSWTIRQFTHTFIGKKIKRLVRKLFLYVFYPVDPSFCRNNLQTKPHQKLVSTGILPYREPSSTSTLIFSHMNKFEIEGEFLLHFVLQNL